VYLIWKKIFSISDDISDENLILKFGRSENIYKRFKTHICNFNKINCNKIELIYTKKFNSNNLITAEELLVKLLLKKSYISFIKNDIINYNNYREIIIIPPKEIEYIKDCYNEIFNILEIEKISPIVLNIKPICEENSKFRVLGAFWCFVYETFLNKIDLYMHFANLFGKKEYISIYIGYNEPNSIYNFYHTNVILICHSKCIDYRSNVKFIFNKIIPYFSKLKRSNVKDKLKILKENDANYFPNDGDKFNGNQMITNVIQKIKSCNKCINFDKCKNEVYDETIICSECNNKNYTEIKNEKLRETAEEIFIKNIVKKYMDNEYSICIDSEFNKEKLSSLFRRILIDNVIINNKIQNYETLVRENHELLLQENLRLNRQNNFLQNEILNLHNKIELLENKLNMKI